MLIKFVYILVLMFCTGVESNKEQTQPPVEHFSSLELQEGHDVVSHFAVVVTGNAPLSKARLKLALNNERVCQHTHLNIISPPPEAAM